MGLMKKLTSALVASSLVLSLAGSAFAAYTPNAGTEAGMRMMELKILKGRPGDDKLAVNAELTRAELVTIIVRAFGKEADAQLLKGAPAFPDTAAHWASGEIAMAKALVEKAGADAIGMPDGTFAPDAKLTPAQAVAFLMKFMGIQRDTTKSWPADYLDAAVEAGLITAEDKATIAPMVNENATRGLAFYLFDNAFYSYELPNGKTFYTTYADTEKPALTATAEATTMDSKVTVTGTVGTDAVAVYVGSTKVTVDANGAFSADVALDEVKEYDILVTAADVAGNVAEFPLKVARIIGTASAIEASDITVAAGATVDVAAAVKDAKGNELKDAVISGTSTVGTFEAGKFTANKTAGTGTLVLKTGDVEKTVNVTITAAALAKVTADKASVNVGEKATLSATDEYGNAITGVTYTLDSADAFVGTTNGVFIASKAGSYAITAKAGDASITFNMGVFGAAKKLAVSAPTQVVANGSTKYAVTVNVIDENGNVVTTDSTTEVTLTAGTGFNVYDKDKANETATSMEKVVSKGSYTFYVAAGTALAGQIVGMTAADTSATPVLTTSSAANVEAVRQVATSLKLTADKTVVKVNAPDTITYTATVLDQKEVAMKSGTYEVKATLTGPATLNVNSGTTYTFTTTAGTGAASIVVNNQQGVTGSISLTTVVDGIGTQTKAVNAAVAGSPAKVVLTAKDADGNAATSAVAGKKLTVKAEVQDANGIPVNYTGTLSIKNSSTDTDIKLRNSADTADVTSVVLAAASSGEFLVYTAGAYTGSFDLTVGPSSGLTKGSITLTETAGKYTQLALTRNNVEVAVSVANPSASFTAQLYDALGNKVAASGVKLTFKGYKAAYGTVVIGTTAVSSEVTFNGTTEKLEVTTDANGAATVTVGTRPFSGTQYAVSVEGLNADNGALTATAAGTNVVGIAVATSVAATADVNLLTLGGAALSNLYLSNSTNPEVLVKVTLKDNYGAKLNGEKANLKIVADEAILWDGTELVKAADYGTVTFVGKGDALPAGVTAAALADGEYYAVVQIAKAGLVNFGVKHAAGPAEISGAKSLLVTAADASLAKINEVNANDGKLYVTAGTVAGPFTVQLTDDYGNAVSSVSKVSIDVSTSTASVRKTASDITATTLDTYGTTTIYVTTPAAGTYSIVLGALGTITVVAE